MPELQGDQDGASRSSPSSPSFNALSSKLPRSSRTSTTGRRTTRRARSCCSARAKAFVAARTSPSSAMREQIEEAARSAPHAGPESRGLTRRRRCRAIQATASGGSSWRWRRHPSRSTRPAASRIKLGLIPCVGGTHRLPLLVGHDAALLNLTATDLGFQAYTGARREGCAARELIDAAPSWRDALAALPHAMGVIQELAPRRRLRGLSEGIRRGLRAHQVHRQRGRRGSWSRSSISAAEFTGDEGRRPPRDRTPLPSGHPEPKRATDSDLDSRAPGINFATCEQDLDVPAAAGRYSLGNDVAGTSATALVAFVRHAAGLRGVASRSTTSGCCLRQRELAEGAGS